MKVRDVMKQSVVSCDSETNAGAAVELLWKNNCGMLPVVDAKNKLIGVVTDRDLCIALGTRNRLPGDLRVHEVIISPAFTCKADDEIHEALLTMAEKQVRRLPVVDDAGVPQGMLSMDDIITHGDLDKWKGCCELSAEEIIRSLKRLYGQKTTKSSARKAAA